MELFVMLLAIGLSSSEKLNRGYLPPPGAKLAGGSFSDLQTPLEYPKENPIFQTNENEYSIGKAELQNNDRDNNFKNHDSLLTSGNEYDKIVSVRTSGNSNDYFETTLYPGNGFDTVATEIPEMVYDDTQSQFGNRYPMKSTSTMKGINRSGYHYLKPVNMPFTAAKEGILSNYNPNVFGLYGGNPMVLKTELNNMFVQPNASLDYTVEDLNTSDQFDGSQKQSPVYLTPESSQRTNPTTFKPVKTVTSVNSLRRRPQRPQAESDKIANEINYKNTINSNEYSYSFDTSNGIHMDETASTINGIKGSGSYSYTGDDGKLYKMVYTADENGFQPFGDHIPTPPPIPEAIQKVIEQVQLDKKAGIYHDGSYDEEKYGYMKYQGPVERYIKNMQVNPKLRNKNRNTDLRKTIVKPLPTFSEEADEYHVNKKTVLNGNTNTLNGHNNNLNGRFGMKNGVPDKKTKAKPNNTLNRQKIFKQRLREPYNRKSTIQINKATKYNDQIGTSGKNIKDSGYYYVPPRQIFIEGTLQDQRTDREHSTQRENNQFSTAFKDLKTETIPESEFYYIDQRNNNDNSKNLFHITTSNLTTEEPESNEQTFAGNYYENINKDLNNSEGKASTSTNGVIAIITTPQPWKNIFNTNTYEQETTNSYHEVTINTEQKEESLSFTGTTLDLSLLSTTPMPPETNNYPNFFSDYNQNQSFNPSEKLLINTKLNTKYSEDGGYSNTIPDVQVFFDDFPSSTYSPIYTANDIQTENIPNIKVDGFGRPILDSQQFNSNTK